MQITSSQRCSIATTPLNYTYIYTEKPYSGISAQAPNRRCVFASIVKPKAIYRPLHITYYECVLSNTLKMLLHPLLYR